MIRKIAIAACFASALTMVSAPANAAAYFIAGQWYFFSIDLLADIGGVTGKDIKDGTFIDVTVPIAKADVLCANPVSKITRPGVGPQGIALGSSGYIKDTDLAKKVDRVKGKIYQTTAEVLDLVKPNFRLSPPEGTCKETAGSEWVPVYWQDYDCNKGLSAVELNALADPTKETYKPICYRDLAIKNTNDELIYISGPFTGYKVGSESHAGPYKNTQLNWTFVYLPTNIAPTSVLKTLDATVDTLTQTCSFPANNETGAKFKGEPYSLRNPPVDGWAAIQLDGNGVDYSCTP